MMRMRANWRLVVAAGALALAVLGGDLRPAVLFGWWTVPNIGTATFAPQAYPFSQDFEVLVRGTRGIGVIFDETNELAVSAQVTPDMTVAVASGSAQFGPATRVVYAGGNATISTAHATNPRIDVVSINSSGTIVVTAGTAAAEASVEPPALPSDHVVLAFVYVPANDTAIQSNQITDKRVGVERHAPTRHNQAGEVLSVSPSTATNNDYNPTGFSEASVVFMSPAVSANALTKISGWVPTYTDRCFKLVNSDADDGIMLTAEDTGSTAANRMTWAEPFPLILFPRESAEFCYENAASRWRLTHSSRPIGPHNMLDVKDEFPGGSITYLGTSTNGTGTSCQTGTFGFGSTEQPQGVVQCDTGTTTTGRASIGYQALQSGSWIPTRGPALFMSRLAPEVLSNATDRYIVTVGFQDEAGGPMADGCYWQYDEGVDPDWRVGCSGSSTATEIDTGVTVTNTYIWVGGYINTAWSRAGFYYSTDSIAWTLVGTGVEDGNIPTLTEQVAPYNTIRKTAGTAVLNLSVDFFGWRYDVAR